MYTRRYLYVSIYMFSVPRETYFLNKQNEQGETNFLRTVYVLDRKRKPTTTGALFRPLKPKHKHALEK